MAALASRTGPLGIAIRGLFDNIGRLTTYAATFAASFIVVARTSNAAVHASRTAGVNDLPSPCSSVHSSDAPTVS